MFAPSHELLAWWGHWDNHQALGIMSPPQTQCGTARGALRTSLRTFLAEATCSPLSVFSCDLGGGRGQEHKVTPQALQDLLHFIKGGVASTHGFQGCRPGEVGSGQQLGQHL